MNRFAIIVALPALLLAASLSADNINFVKADKTIDSKTNVKIKSWSWAQVDWVSHDGKSSGSIKRRQLVSITRTRTTSGTMGKELSSAIDQLGTDPAGAQETLLRVAGAGSALDKEEATFLLGVLAAQEATNRAGRAAAISGFSAYVKAYASGNFAKEAYTQLASLQRWNRDASGARRTLQKMVKVGLGLDVMGSQLLGELEFDQKKYAAAISAFKAAGKAAGNNKNLKYKANAWQGLSLLKKGDVASAKSVLEPIVADKDFEDPESNDDDLALAVAYPALGDIYFAQKTYAKAYDSYILGGFHAWWIGGTQEGYCLSQAWRCTKRLTTSGKKWTNREKKLKESLQTNYPSELKRAKVAEEKGG